MTGIQRRRRYPPAMAGGALREGIRILMAGLAIEREILIEAPPEVVWRTITEPDQMSQWFADRVDLVVEPGAHGYMQFGDQGGPVVVETVDPPARFSFRWNHPSGRGTGARQLDAGGVHAHARRQRADPPSGNRKRPRAARLARRGEAAVCRRAPGRLGRVPGPPGQRAREAPSGMTAQADDELWSAIGDPSRRRILDLLVSNGAVSASWLAGHVPFSRQAVSKHLAVLEQTGLVSRRKHGREVLYQVQAGRLDQATRAMADLAAQWDRRLGAIKRLAEAAHAQAEKRRLRQSPGGPDATPRFVASPARTTSSPAVTT